MVGGLPPGVSDRAFDAQFLHGPVWRLDDPTHAGEATAAARVFGVQLISARVDPAVDLGAFGFRRIETLVTYEGALDATALMPAGVRLGDGADAPACAEIAAAAFTQDRWHADPEIPARAADSFKRAWVENDVRGRADSVLVATDVEGVVQGFVLVLERESVAVIDLIAVAPSAQGQGIGRRLMAALSAQCGPRCTRGQAGTQATNTASCTLYAGAGWRWIQRQITWHWTPAGAA